MNAASDTRVAVRHGPWLGDYLRFLTPPRLAKLAYGIVVSIVVGEIAIVLISPRQEVLPKDLVTRDPELGFRMVANYRGVEPRDGIPLVTNSRGLREREIGERRGDVFRVVVLGDSVVFGLGVHAEAAFPRALEGVLRDRLQRPVEVINGGVPGYGTMQELKLFEESVEALRPDLVLVTVSVFNDVEDNVKFAAPEKRWQNTPGTIYHPLKWLREHSQLYLMMRRYRSGVSAEKMMDIHAVSPSEKTMRGLRITEESLASFRRSAEEHGVRFAVVLAPAQKQVSPLLWEQTLREHGLEAGNYDRDLPNRRLRTFARRERVPVLDLRPALEQDHETIYENEHWKPEGHALVAIVVADFLRDRSLVAPSAAGGGRGEGHS